MIISGLWCGRLVPAVTNVPIQKDKFFVGAYISIVLILIQIYLTTTINDSTINVFFTPLSLARNSFCFKNRVSELSG